ncbi:MAG TPA: tetratricopeptide repeat protein [Bryobacteraceae bacterium]|nr:tetratricopeptide repeat protein [Bryobacteraceae bacterium]
MIALLLLALLQAAAPQTHRTTLADSAAEARQPVRVSATLQPAAPYSHRPSLADSAAEAPNAVRDSNALPPAAPLVDRTAFADSAQARTTGRVSDAPHSSTPQTQWASLAARAAAARKAGRDSDALQLYEQALHLKPGWGDGWWNVAAIEYERNNYAAARDALRKLVALDPKAVAGLALLGICEYKTGDFDAALEHLDAAHTIGLGPANPLGNAAIYYLAVLLNRQGRHDAAAGLLLSAPENKVVAPALLEAIGLTGLRLAKLPEDLTPAEKDMALAVGRALAAPEAEATAALRALLEAHPDQPNLHYLYGMVLLHGDTAAAFEQFQRELARDPKHVPSLLAIVNEMERESQYSQALPYAQRAVAAEPDNFAAHAILGRVLISLDRTAEGVRELETAKQLEPGSPQIYFSLASAYAKLGRTEDAEKARAEFLRLKNGGNAGH